MNSWPALKFYPSHNIITIIIIVVVIIIKITITIITQLHRIVYLSINQEQIFPLIIIIIIIILLYHAIMCYIIICCYLLNFVDMPIVVYAVCEE
jgi:hypothetical protein